MDLRDSEHMISPPESIINLFLDPAVISASGLESEELTGAFIILAVGIALWGFERYRTNFSKAEFLVAILLSGGVFVIGVFPDVFNILGSVLEIDRRPLTISLVTNIVMVLLLLYLLAQTRANQLSVAELTRNLAIKQASDDDEDDEPADDPSVYVVIPAYNEAESIQGVVDSLPDSVHGHTLTPLVVSDGSTDGTVARIESTDAMVVNHPINQGQGGALRTGFEIARQNGADIVVTMDADGQHPVEYLDDLIEPVIADEADYVVGSRYIGVDNTKNGVTRQTGIRVFTTLINMMTKADVTDCTNGFRAIRSSKLRKMTLSEERFSAPELLIEARKNGLRIVEVPITVAQREAGQTKKPKLGYAVGLTRTILVTWIR